MHVGFTGTRYGMTVKQREQVTALVHDLTSGPLTFHHGDCVGADAEFHRIALDNGGRVVIHPPIDKAHRAFCKPADEWRMACTHLARNRAIVIEATVMIATPYEMDRQMRGGTWYTIDRAERAGKPLVVVQPNGVLVYFGAPWP